MGALIFYIISFVFFCFFTFNFKFPAHSKINNINCIHLFKYSTSTKPAISFNTDFFDFDSVLSLRHLARMPEFSSLYPRLIKHLLRRIEVVDDIGDIHSIIELNPNLESDIKGILDNPGPLHGLPIGIKTSINIRGMSTNGGSELLAEAFPQDDAFIIKNLRKAGAIFMAHTNMSEFASSAERFGYSSHGGLTRNPHDPTKDVAGSSGGSAAAVAAKLVLAAIGTDTVGSVRAPASRVGIAGLRPTRGLLSSEGIMPVSTKLDTAGLMARNVSDLAVLLSHMAGVDPKDKRTIRAVTKSPRDYVAFLNTFNNPFKNLNIGVIDNFFGGNREVDHIINKQVSLFSKLGAKIIRLNFPDEFLPEWNFMKSIIGIEFRSLLNSFLRSLSGDHPKTLSEIIRQSSSRVNPALLEELIFMDTYNPGDVEIKKIYHRMSKITEKLLHIIKKRNISIFVYPTVACPACPVYTEKDPSLYCNVEDPFRALYLASVTGWPDITIPAGMTKSKLPVGISMLSSAYKEPLLLQLAYRLEMENKERGNIVPFARLLQEVN